MATFTRTFLTKQMWHTRLLIALSSLTWAFLLFWSNDVFTRKTYELMAQLAPQVVWASLFFIHGIAAIRSIVCEECSATFCRKWGRELSFVSDSLLGMLLWTSSTLLCFAAHWPTTGSWIQQLASFPAPAAMAGEFWVAVYSWVYFIFTGADIMKGKDNE